MAAKPLRTKPKSASAERCLRALGATRDMATPDMETSNCACEGCIVAWRFTKRQPGGRGDYWGLSLSGNCCTLSHFAARLSQLLYRRLNGLLYRSIGGAHSNRKILVDRHVSRHGDGQARWERDACINGNGNSIWQGD